MSPGPEREEQGLELLETGVFRFPRALSASKSAFTLIELLVSALILSVVLGGLFITLNIGDRANYISGPKVDLQANVRQVINIIANDVRQSSSSSEGIAYAGHSASATHIKFKQVQGWNNTANQLVLSSGYIEYIYDPDNDKMARNVLDASSNVVSTQEFSDITNDLNDPTQAPFSTRDTVGNIVTLTDHASDLLTSGVLIINIIGQKQLRGGINFSYNLSEEVKIRNE